MKTKPKIAIIDYGVGNLRSLIRAFEYNKAQVLLTESAQDIHGADALVLPGDGAFAAGMKGLALRDLTDSVWDFAKTGKPILGICLGAQIMLSWGFEFGKHRGLDLVGGKVVKFPHLKDGAKIPQIGWNGIYPAKSWSWDKTILDSIKPGSDIYYIHSYIMVPNNTKSTLATSTHGGLTFCSVISQGNIYGCQFHPEKSGEVGLKIIDKFIFACRTPRSISPRKFIKILKA